MAGFSFKDEKRLGRALGLIGHRGPDSRGVYADENIPLGHCRLSIIDLGAGGGQPMTSPDDILAIVFNGEIYNYRELKKELAGYEFKGNSDTEVMLAGYQKQGAAFFDKLRGMWAFALYDKIAGKIILARDHFGIKPLLYSVSNGRLYFASEMKALKSLVDKLTPNTEKYYQFFNLGYFLPPDTCYREIKRLRPGEVITFNQKTGTGESRIIPLIKDRDTAYAEDFAAAADILDAALRDSVRAHYVSDVPVGLLLSGGCDSSLLAALSAAEGFKPAAYSLDIQNSLDARYAREIAGRLGLKLKQIPMTAADLEKQYNKVWSIIDEPTADSSVIPTALIYSMIAGQGKVVLSGEGGDELAGGYRRHEVFARLRSVKENNFIFSAFDPLTLSRGAFALKYTDPLARRARNLALNYLADDMIGSYLASARLIDQPHENKRMRATLYRAWQEETRWPREISANLFFDRALYLSNDLMYKNDMASMANSIEARVPFLDKPLWQTVFRRIKPEFLLSPAYTGKKILKTLLRRYLPADLVERPKKGFGFSFKRYALKEFYADYASAARWHSANLDAFDLEHSRFKRILSLSPDAAKLVADKFSSFAFALVSNWKIFAK